MRLPITKIKGAENLPQVIEKLNPNYPPEHDINTSRNGVNGFNIAVDQLNQCVIVLDEEEIFNELQNTINPMSDAPEDKPIIGVYPDSMEVEIEWAETRQCMLAGVGGGNGYFGAGWQDTYNKLIADMPVGWKEYTKEESSYRNKILAKAICANLDRFLRIEKI